MRYVFGPYSFDTPSGELSCDGVPVPLERQAARVLTYLLQHRTRVVPAQELLTQLWPARYVSRWVLPRCIRLVRHALGDTSRQQHAIKTVHRYGYRFVAAVEEHASPPSPPAGLPAVPILPQASRPATSPLRGREQQAVTVLACTIVAPIVLALPGGPETWPDLLEAVFSQAQRSVSQYGGTIHAWLADGFVALFGVPVPHEEHAWHALLAATALCQSFQAGDAAPVRRFGGALTLRMGVHSGRVVGRHLGDDRRLTYLAVGETLHMARSLEHQAAPGTILISEATVRHTRGEVQLTGPSPLHMPHVSTPVQAYTVLGVSPHRAALPQRAGRARSPLVGRAQEWALLDTRLRQAQHGHGHVVHLVGTAGLGKSRLVAEVAHRWGQRGVAVLTGACQPYGQTLPYLPIRALLRQYFGVTPTDPPDAVRATVHQALGAGGLEPQTTAPALLALLGEPTAETPLPEGSPAAHSARLFATIGHLLATRAQDQPLVLVLEDLHWMDHASEALCEALVAQIARTALVLLVTFRPEYHPPWPTTSQVTHLPLRPLTPQESHRIVRAATDARTVPASLLQTIVTTAAGNPLFLEELTAAVLDRDAPAAADTVPATLHGVLLARIDRLAEAPRQLLKMAAVLGQTWPRALIERLWQEPPPLPPLLQELQQREFLAVQFASTDPVYHFTHPLLQHTAYESLTPAARQTLHAAVGQALEAQYATHLDAVMAPLAFHYAQTTEHAKAVMYLTQAGDQALHSHAYGEATVAFQQALTHVAQLPPADQAPRLDIVARLAQTWSFVGRFAESRDLLLQHQPQVEALQDDWRSGPFYFRLGRTLSLLGDQEQAAWYTHQALTIARRCGDRGTWGRAAYERGRELLLSAPPHRVLAYGRQAVAQLTRTEDQWWCGMTHWLLGVTYGFLGAFTQALAATARAQALGEALHDAHVQSYATFTTGWLEALRGHHRAGSAACRLALSLAEDPVNTAHARGALGAALIEGGHAAQALPLLAQAAQAWQQFRLLPMQGWIMALWAQAYLQLHQLAHAAPLAQEALAISQTAQFPYAMGLALRVLGHIALAQGHCGDASTHLTTAQATFTTMRARFEVGRTHLTLADLAQAQQHHDLLATHLTTALTLFRRLRVPSYVAQVTKRARAVGLTLHADRGR